MFGKPDLSALEMEMKGIVVSFYPLVTHSP